jgi:hypothetical protein
MPLYPQKCYEPGSVPQNLDFSIISMLGSHWSLCKSLGARHKDLIVECCYHYLSLFKTK